MSTSVLHLPQVSFGVQVSLKEGSEAEVSATVVAAVWYLAAVDARCLRNLVVLNAVGVAVVTQQLLQMVALPTNVTAELLLTCVGPLVNPELRLVEELLATCRAGGAGVSVGQLVGVFVEDVVLQAAVRLPTDGTELSLTTVDSLVAAKVGHL